MHRPLKTFFLRISITLVFFSTVFFSTTFVHAQEVHRKNADYSLRIGDVATFRDWPGKQNLTNVFGIRDKITPVIISKFQTPQLQYAIRVRHENMNSFTVAVECRIFTSRSTISPDPGLVFQVANRSSWPTQFYLVTGVTFGGYMIYKLTFSDMNKEDRLPEIDRVFDNNFKDIRQFALELTRIIDVYGDFATLKVRLETLPHVDSPGVSILELLALKPPEEIFKMLLKFPRKNSSRWKLTVIR